MNMRVTITTAQMFIKLNETVNEYSSNHKIWCYENLPVNAKPSDNWIKELHWSLLIWYHRHLLFHRFICYWPSYCVWTFTCDAPLGTSMCLKCARQANLSASVTDHQFNMWSVGTVHLENVAPDCSSKNHVTSKCTLYTWASKSKHSNNTPLTNIFSRKT